MRLIIFGGRDFTDFELLEQEVWEFIRSNTIIVECVVIISGEAKGADQLGELFATHNDLTLKRFPANWNKHGRSAGPIRNTEMANYCTHAIGFWDGKSKGTYDMINRVRSAGKQIKVVKY